MFRPTAAWFRDLTCFVTFGICFQTLQASTFAVDAEFGSAPRAIRVSLPAPLPAKAAPVQSDLRLNPQSERRNDRHRATSAFPALARLLPANANRLPLVAGLEVTVAVSPQTANLGAAETQQFTATVTGATNTGVTWAISPTDAGTITASGLYTSPAVITAAQAVTITATSIEDPTKAASATVNLRPAVTVAVAPSTATLESSQTQQFSATVTGAADATVTWSVMPAGTGTITADGLYTAPAVITATQTATVTATSVADPAKSSTAAVTLQVPAVTPNTFVPIRVNAAGPAYIDSQDRVWSADTGFSGSWNYSFAPPPGTDFVYASGRRYPYEFRYQAAVPNLDYAVTLKFADHQFAAAGQRRFNVVINGQTALTGVDVAANAGGQYKPWDAVVPVTVTGGQITIQFVPVTGEAIISAVEIVAKDSVEVRPRTATLAARQTLQLGATVQGAPGAPVVWSITPPDLGTISPSGLYTAPAAVAASSAVTVTAANAADGSHWGNAVITLSSADPNTVAPIRVNANGPQFKDSQGRIWGADSGFTSSWNFSFAPPAGTDPVYGTGRRYPWEFVYQTAVPNLEYVVTLKFADHQFSAPGQRLFDVAVNGYTVRTRVDVAANAGGQYKPWDLTIPVIVSDGQIAIRFVPVVGEAIINAIEIVPRDAVEVLPRSVALAARQSLQFSAMVQGAQSGAVTWSVDPAGAGTITSTGLYTAPATIAAASTAKITAIRSDNPNQWGTATVNLTPVDPLTVTAVRVNAAGPAYLDAAGRAWSADAGFNSGWTFSFSPPSGLEKAYSTGRRYPWAFQFQTSLANLEYAVTLKFADPDFSTPGQRLFDVAVNGQTVLTRVDVAALAGGRYKPWDVTVPATVTNGQLSVQFIPVTGEAIINAIEVIPRDAIEVLPRTATLTANQVVPFHALVQGAPDAQVTWSIQAPIGAISPSGVYAAPASVSTPTSVTVTATSTTNPNRWGSATVNLVPLDPAVPNQVRVNAAGPAYTDAQGHAWTADSGFTSSWTFSFTPPPGTDTVYATGRRYAWPFRYQTALPNMQYLVTLKFADHEKTAAGQRLFDVAINGYTVLSRVDVVAGSGGQFKPWDVSVPAAPVDGQITIDFIPVIGEPIINGIEIVPVGTAEIKPTAVNLWANDTQQFTARVADPTNAGLVWSMVPPGSGVLTQTGLFTAPPAIAVAQTVTVTATAIANPQWTASAAVSLLPPLTVSVSPQTAALGASQTQQFTATLTNNGGTGVTWSLNPAGMGTITESGLYSAPSAIYTVQPVTIIATAADGRTRATATVTLTPSVTVTLAPKTVTLRATESQQFTATVGGAWDSSVTWAVSPAGGGTISADGLYTAPGTVGAATTVTVSAKSAVDPTKSDTATVTLSAAPPGPFTPIRVNAGGSEYRDSRGRLWSADAGFVDGAVFSYTAPVAGTDTPALYQTGRWRQGTLQYQFPVPNGNYSVTLKFADNYYGNPGQRVFDVVANGQKVLSRVDVAASAGGVRKPWDAKVPAVVAAGQLTLQFVPVVEWPIVNAIEIVAEGDVELLPGAVTLGNSQTQQFTVAIDGEVSTDVIWSVTPTGVGTLSPTGLYTAPAAIAAAGTVTITATSIANPAKSSSATVTLSPVDPVSIAPIRVNSGGPDVTDPQGRLWRADTGFTGGNTFSFTAPVPGTDAPALYQNGRWGSFQYQFTVPNMKYVATLKFADNYFTATGRRMFDVLVNGQRVLSRLDVIAQAGGQYGPWDAKVPVSVTGGQITIQFAAIGIDWPIINAIEIVPADASEIVAVTPSTAQLSALETHQFQATVGGVQSEQVSWSTIPSGMGSITATGLYTAPAAIAAPQTLTVQVANITNPARTATAKVTLVPPVIVAVSPNAVTLGASQSQQFTAAVSGGGDQAVTWSVSPAGMGTISANGFYTAPSSISTTGTVIIRATSATYPNRFGTATVSLTPAAVVTPTDPSQPPGPDPNAAATVTFGGAADPADPYVVAKANELGKDAARIFEFVRGLGYEVYHGSLRGARGTLWSKAGNSLDKASLLLALLKASGLDGRYVRGTLQTAQKQQLILSMFKAPSRVTGCPPPNAKRADPANDPDLLADAGDHFWVEYGPGFTPADPSFGSAQLGQAFGAATERFTEIPVPLRHRVTVKLDVEKHSRIAQIFGLDPFSTTTVVRETFDTVDLVGRPLTLGHFVQTENWPSPLGFGNVTHSYSPYLRIGVDAADVNKDATLTGQSYEEVLYSTLTWGSTFVSGAFLKTEVIDSRGHAKEYEHTVLDRRGYAARHGYPTTTAISASGEVPAFTDLDQVTFSVLSGTLDQKAFAAYSQIPNALQTRREALAPRLQQVSWSAPTPTDQSVIAASSALNRDLTLSLGRVANLAYAVQSTEADKLWNSRFLVRTVVSGPRIVVFSTQAKYDPASSSARLSMELDLVKGDVRVLDPPGQVAKASFGYRMMRGLVEAQIENTIISGLTQPDSSGIIRKPVSIIEIFNAADEQSIRLVPIFDAATLDGLAFSADAKARITDALKRGKFAIAPERAPVLSGTPVVAWLEFDPSTGEMIDVREGGGHGSFFEYFLLNQTMAGRPVVVAISSAMGFMWGFASEAFTFSLQLCLLEATTDAGSKQNWNLALSFARHTALQLWAAIDLFMVSSGYALAAAAFGVAFSAGMEAADAMFALHNSTDPPIPDIITGPAQELAPGTGGSAPAVSASLVTNAQYTVPVGGAQFPLVYRAEIRNLGPATDTFSLSLPSEPAGFKLLQSLPSVTVPAGQTGEIGVCVVPADRVPDAGTTLFLSAAVQSATYPHVQSTANASVTVPPVQGVTLAAVPAVADVVPGGSLVSLLTVKSVGNVAVTPQLIATASPGLTLSSVAASMTLPPGSSRTESLRLDVGTAVPIGTLLSATVRAETGSPYPANTSGPQSVPAGGSRNSAYARSMVENRSGSQPARLNGIRNPGSVQAPRVGADIPARDLGSWTGLNRSRPRSLAAYPKPTQPRSASPSGVDLVSAPEAGITPPGPSATVLIRVVPRAAAASSEASLAASVAGRPDIAAVTSRLGDAITSLAKDPANTNAKAQVLFYTDNLIALMNTPYLAGVASQLTAAREAIANATPETMPAALNSLGAALGDLKTALSSREAFPFDLVLEPNSATAQPNMPSTFIVLLTNKSATTQTYAVSLAGVPGTVASSLSRSSITLGPGETSPVGAGPNSVYFTLTPSGALDTFEFSVTASIAGISGAERTIKGILNARAEVLAVQAVNASPAFVEPGATTVVTATLANILNRDRIVNAALAVKNASGQTVLTPPAQPVHLSLLSVLAPVSFGTVNTQGLAAGSYTLHVTVTDPVTNQVLPGGTGQGTLLIGSPVTAKLTVTPQIVATGDSRVSTTLNVTTGADRENPLILLGTVQTPSSAGSLAVNGNTAYVCDHNEISVLDVANPADPRLLTTAGLGQLQNAWFGHCAIQRDSLVAFADVDNSQLGNNPTFVAYSLADPLQPALVKATTVRKRFYMEPVYVGNIAFVPTRMYNYFLGWWDNQHGDVVAVDVSDFAKPVVLGALSGVANTDEAGGPSPFHAVAAVNPQLLYAAGTTSTGAANAGSGRLVAIDISNPAAMSVVKEVLVPDAKDLHELLFQGSVAVAIGQDGGYSGVWGQDPGFNGNIVVATFDISDPRNPALLTSRKTGFRFGKGGGSARIGDNLFLFAGVADAEGRSVLLLVDAADPRNPVLRSFPIVMPVTRMRAVGDVLHTANGLAGYAAYRIPGIATVPFTAQVQVPKNTGAAYDPLSFTVPPSSILPGTAYDTLVWSNPPTNVITWNSALTGMQAGEVRTVALGGSVAFSGAYGAGTVPLPALTVVAEQILGLNPPVQTVAAGSAAPYTLIVKNPTSSEVTYSLSAAGVQPAWLSVPAQVSVPAADYVSVPVTFQTEPSASPATYAFVFTATAGGVRGSVEGKAIVTGPGASGGMGAVGDASTYGPSLTISPPQATAGQGTSASFDVVVGNAGSVADTYNLSALAPSGLTVSLERATVMLQPGTSQKLKLLATVAPGTPVGPLVFTVRAVSATKSTAVQEQRATVNVVAAGVALEVSPLQTGPGGTLELTVTNRGQSTDTFDLAISGPAGALVSSLGATAVTLAPSASQAVQVTIGPADFALRGVLPLYATATSRTEPAVSALASAGIVIPDRKSVTAGFDPTSQDLAAPGPATFYLRVENTGSVQDSYSATLTTTGPVQATMTGLNGEPTTSIPTFVLPAQSGGLIAVNATSLGGTGTITITVQSLTEPSATAVATATLSSPVVALYPPVANAGLNRSVPLGVLASLDGSGSTDPNTPPRALTYQWSVVAKPAGSNLSEVNSATSVRASFRPDVLGEYTFRLTVSNGEKSAEATVTITAVDAPPVAKAGRTRNVKVGAWAMLDGSESFDPEGSLITYVWQFASVPQGSTLTNGALLNSLTPKPFFQPDVAGAYHLRLVVSDALATSSPDFVDVNAYSGNIAPNADAGLDQNVRRSSAVTLDGSGSADPDGGPAPLTFAWAFQAVPDTSMLTDAAISANNTARPQFTPDVDGDYFLKLSVSDGEYTSTAQVVVHAFSANVPPLADAGPDRAVLPNTPAVMDGSASSDPDNGPGNLGLSWSLVSKAPESVLQTQDLSGPTTAAPSLTPDRSGYYVTRLAVNDQLDESFDNALVTAAAACDADANGYLNRTDISLVQSAVGTSAGPNDSRDFDRDGKITATDVQGCEAILPASSLRVSPESLSFYAESTLTLSLTTTGGPLDYTVTTDRPWISVEPVTSRTDRNPVLIVTVNPAGLPFGTYTGAITITPSGGGGAVVVPVMLNLPLMPVPVSVGDRCVYALNRTAADALRLNGEVNVNANCGVVVDSGSSSALSLVGAATLTAKYIDLVGWFSKTPDATVSPAPRTNAPFYPDPFALLVPPTADKCDYKRFKATAPATLSPGTYCDGISIGGEGTITFNPGLYVLMGGGLKIPTTATVTGSGVTFFLTEGLGYKYGSASVSGAPALTLRAPSEGPYAGILVFQDPRLQVGKPASSITGSPASTLDGVLYFPRTGLVFSGGSEASGGGNLIIVADSVEFKGQSIIRKQ